MTGGTNRQNTFQVTQPGEQVIGVTDDDHTYDDDDQALEQGFPPVAEKDIGKVEKFIDSDDGHDEKESCSFIPHHFSGNHVCPCLMHACPSPSVVLANALSPRRILQTGPTTRIGPDRLWFVLSAGNRQRGEAWLRSPRCCRQSVLSGVFYLRRQPAQTGSPLSSRSVRTSAPFFTSAAMRAGAPSMVMRDPLTSTWSFASMPIS